VKYVIDLHVEILRKVIHHLIGYSITNDGYKTCKFEPCYNTRHKDHEFKHIISRPISNLQVEAVSCMV
jgi:hypothetical protein